MGRPPEWTEEEDKRLFTLFKQKGPHWSVLAKGFPGRTDNQIKNRFYSTLRRVATKKRSTDPSVLPDRAQCKQELLKYVDEALEYGRHCWSKRGRKKKRPSFHEPPVSSDVAFQPFADLVARYAGQGQALTAETGHSAMLVPRLFPRPSIPPTLKPSLSPCFSGPCVCAPPMTVAPVLRYCPQRLGWGVPSVLPTQIPYYLSQSTHPQLPFPLRLPQWTPTYGV